jgi:ribonuclease P protein component
MPSVATDVPVVMSRPELWRISDRSTFAALRRRGRRAQAGPITVTWLRPQPQEPATPPRVGFAVSRAVGGAVVRNRIRRRLRAGLRELQRADALPHGAYLVGATSVVARLPWSDLQATLAQAVAAATQAPTDAP